MIPCKLGPPLRFSKCASFQEAEFVWSNLATVPRLLSVQEISVQFLWCFFKIFKIWCFSCINLLFSLFSWSLLYLIAHIKWTDCWARSVHPIMAMKSKGTSFQPSNQPTNQDEQGKKLKTSSKVNVVQSVHHLQWRSILELFSFCSLQCLVWDFCLLDRLMVSSSISSSTSWLE